MVSQKVPEKWLDTGGTRAEYAIFKALYRTGRKAGVDFIYQPGQQMGPSFVVFEPRVGLKVTTALGGQDGLAEITKASAGIRVEFIPETQAINEPERALNDALEGR